jgi:UDP-N-acetylglucosamine--N-acetylmuramyl-(pentapeptide) pyrophosphoryl-undecaprenol N-acetylglucosamine transferase
MIKRAIISGGGTGGHIFPAIAIATELKKRYPSCEILFVGAKGKMEMEKVPAAGFKIIGLPIRGFQRNAILKNWDLPFRVIKSLWLSYRLIKKHKPEIVIGVGGYASAAVGKTAQWMHIPTLLQEQNGYAGMTNKILAKQAKSICVAYPNMDKFFPKHKIQVTGNPVRSKILNIPKKSIELYKEYGLNTEKPILLVIGGSLGARTINNAIEKHLNELLKSGIQIIWQTGKSFKSDIKKQEGLYRSVFIRDMEKVYSIADFIVSRAGAISISELCLVGKPTILIPSPNVAEDHQTKNAQILSNAHAAILLKDKEAESGLLHALRLLMNDTDKQKELSLNIKRLSQPKAVEKIVDQIEAVI